VAEVGDGVDARQVLELGKAGRCHVAERISHIGTVDA